MTCEIRRKTALRVQKYLLAMFYRVSVAVIRKIAVTDGQQTRKTKTESSMNDRNGILNEKKDTSEAPVGASKRLMVAARIRAFRRAHHMTQDELGNRLGVTPQAVSRWEREECYPDILILYELAQLFGCSMEDFFE